MLSFFFFQAEDGIRDAQESRGLGDVYKRQPSCKTLAHSRLSPFAFTNDLIAPATFLPLTTFLIHSASSVHFSSNIYPKYLNLSLIHISEPTRLLSISYAVFCLKKKKKKFIFFLMIRRPPRSTLDRSSAASDVYKRQTLHHPFTFHPTYILNI